MSERGEGFNGNNSENVHEHSGEGVFDTSSEQENKNTLVQKFQGLYSKIDQIKFKEEKEIAIQNFYTALDKWAHENEVTLAPFEGAESQLLNKGNIVRRDNPEKVLALLTGQEQIHIRPLNDGDANVATDAYEGLNLALTEGFHGKNVVSVYGFHPNTEAKVMQVKKPSEDMRDPKRFHYIRSFSGDVNPEDIRFVLFRFPSTGVPESVLTESEEEKLEDDIPLRYVYRSISFPKGIGGQEKTQ